MLLLLQVVILVRCWSLQGTRQALWARHRRGSSPLAALFAVRCLGRGCRRCCWLQCYLIRSLSVPVAVVALMLRLGNRPRALLGCNGYHAKLLLLLLLLLVQEPQLLCMLLLKHTFQAATSPGVPGTRRRPHPHAAALAAACVVTTLQWQRCS